MKFKVYKEGSTEFETWLAEPVGPVRPKWLTWANVRYAVVVLLLTAGVFGIGYRSGKGTGFDWGCAPRPGPGPEPGPGPTPTPPTPNPQTMQACVLVYESSADSASANVWGSREIQEYLAAKIPGKYRMIDQNADVADAPDWVKEAMRQNRTSIPILVCQDKNGKWYSAAWPKTIAEAMETLRKYGGPRYYNWRD